MRKRRCPKCGGDDLYLHYYPAGATWGHGSKKEPRTNKFVVIDGWKARALQEVIECHCRTCQYEWDIAPLKGSK